MELKNSDFPLSSILIDSNYLQIIDWYKQLTLEEKKNLPIKNNSIDLKNFNIKFQVLVSNGPNEFEIKDIINQDLYDLNILAFYYPSKLNKREIIQYQVSKLILDKSILSTASFTGEIGKIRPSKTWRNENFGFNFTEVGKYSNELRPLIDKMVSLKLIDMKASTRVNNYRIRALNWFRNLSITDKKEHIQKHNGIYFQSILSKFEYKDYTDQYFKPVIEEINQNLNILGIISGLLPDVFSPFKVKHEKNIKEWKELSNIPIFSKAELVIPTIENPHLQIKHLFAQHLVTKVSKSHRDDIKSVFKHLTQFIKIDYGNQPILLINWLDEFTLNRFHKYLEEQMIEGNLNNRFANVLQTTFKNVLNRAKTLNFPNFKRFYLSSSFSYSDRVTNNYKPYSDSEKADINLAITSEIKYIKNLTPEYKIPSKSTLTFKNNKDVIKKSNTEYSLDDARWIFENHLNSKPILNAKDFKRNKYSEKFYRIIASKKLYFHDVYESWGILTKVTVKHIAPFYLRFLQITGMNIESVSALELNDFIQEHPASGKSCIRYWKERSHGEKEYHLDIFKANLQWMTHKQSQEVKDIFDTVIKITSSIRKTASKDLKDKLWLFTKKNGKLYSLPDPDIRQGLLKLSDKYKLKSVDNNLELITTRFRPTFVSELVDKGVSIREVQLLLGHKNLYTTMRYLDIQDFSKISRGKIKDKLLQIHINANSSIKNLKLPAPKDETQVMLSTPFATCKNIFKPPESVRKLSSYTPGKPCSTYNMCLSCSNVIITISDLPKLLAMKRDYLTKIQNTRVLDTPFGEVINTNLSLINEITDKDKSSFSVEELDEAEVLSLYVETTEIY